MAAALHFTLVAVPPTSPGFRNESVFLEANHGMHFTGFRAGLGGLQRRREDAGDVSCAGRQLEAATVAVYRSQAAGGAGKHLYLRAAATINLQFNRPAGAAVLRRAGRAFGRRWTDAGAEWNSGDGQGCFGARVRTSA